MAVRPSTNSLALSCASAREAGAALPAPLPSGGRLRSRHAWKRPSRSSSRTTRSVSGLMSTVMPAAVLFGCGAAREGAEAVIPITNETGNWSSGGWGCVRRNSRHLAYWLSAANARSTTSLRIDGSLESFSVILS